MTHNRVSRYNLSMTTTAEAEDFLLTILAEGMVSLSDVRAAAEAANMPWKTIQRAKMNLGITSLKEGFPAVVIGWVRNRELEATRAARRDPPPPKPKPPKPPPPPPTLAPPTTRMGEAQELILALLQDGPQNEDRIHLTATRLEINWHLVKRAARVLGILTAEVTSPQYMIVWVMPGTRLSPVTDLLSVHEEMELNRAIKESKVPRVTKVARAEQILFNELSRGPCDLPSLQAIAEREDIPWFTFQNAKRKLGVHSTKAGFPAVVTAWALPEEPQTERSEVLASGFTAEEEKMLRHLKKERERARGRRRAGR